MSKSMFSYITITGLIIILIFTIQGNIKQKNKLKQLEITLKENIEKEQLVIKYKEDLNTIKELKQEILGQENKLNELQAQIKNFTETLINNQEKLGKLES